MNKQKPEKIVDNLTPRTDSEEQWAEWNGNQFKCVHSSFARELELEINKLRLLNPGTDQYECAICHGVFYLGWSYEDATAEAEINGMDVNNCVIVCDDCYKKTPWGRDS